MVREGVEEEVTDKNINLRVTNMVCSGRLPFNKISIKELIVKSDFEWHLINELTSPILQTKFYRGRINIRGKAKCICVSVWHSGAINIVGVKSFKEAKKYYKLICDDIKKNLKELK